MDADDRGHAATLRGMRSSRRSTPTRRSGTTLVEVLIALLVFDLSLMSLVAVSAVAVRRVGDAGRRNRAAIAAVSRLEALTAVPCASIAGGTARLERGVSESWTVSSVGTGRELTDSIRIESRAPEVLVLRVRRSC
jgi:Tfp pilus assembly protein PilV